MKMNSEKEYIKAAWLFPDTLYLHGDRGNILTLTELSKKMGMELKLDKINLGDDFNVQDYDLIYVPPGELKRAQSVINHLTEKRDDLEDFIKRGGILLVTGTSLSFFGESIKRENETIDGLGLIGIDSSERDSVYGDDLFFEASYNGHYFPVYGNQIQMIDIDLKDGTPFGKLHYGYGNNGKTRFEGVIQNKSIFTNTLGPFLSLNPWFAVELINSIREDHGLERIKPDFNFDIERKSLESKLRYTQSKKSDLTNTSD